MQHLYPPYYGDFHCIAQRCPDSCCHEWDVQIDPDTARRYHELPGALGEALRDAMYEDSGDVYLRNCAGRCPMWQQDGLCRIQCALGHDALSQVCREFPRITQDYGSFVEHALEMSCPEAARLILTDDRQGLDKTQTPDNQAPDYDAELMDLLIRTRPAAYAILEDDRFSVPQRLAVLLLYGYHVQSQIDGAEEVPFDPQAALAEAAGFAAEGSISALTGFFRELEILTDRWRDTLEHAHAPHWERALTRLARYGIYRYFYQAVCDYDLVSRVKFVVIFCIMMAYLSAPSLDGLIAGAQLFSKEIENDSENMDALLDGAYTAPALTDANLLGLLLRT